MSYLKLSHEYNEFIIGYIVTDANTKRTVNFQFESEYTNNPEPSQILGYARQGDETSEGWDIEELEYITEWLRVQSDADNLENCMTIIFNNDDKKQKFYDLLATNEVSEYDIHELGVI